MASNGQTMLSSFYNITTASASTNPTTTTTTTELPDDASSFLLQRLKSMSDRLPRVDDDGLPYKFVPGESGRQSVKNRQTVSNRELQSILKDFPHRPLQIFNDPRIRASSRRVGKTSAEVKQLYIDTAKLDDDLADEAKLDNRGYKRYFKKAVPGIQIGSKHAIENLMEHITKGCFADPLPPHQMSYIASGEPPTDGGPPRKRRRRGTNIVENNNRYAVRSAVGKSNRQASSLTQRKFLIFTFLHNLNTDARIEHITGRKALGRDWFVREALRGSVQLKQPKGP